MEMPEQNRPDLFSQMLHMFPNIPQDIIWLYVQQYSSDIETCTQMLHLQNKKHASTKSTFNSDRNLNESNHIFQTSDFLLEPETISCNNNDDVPLSNELPTRSSDNVIIQNDNEQSGDGPYNPLSINSPFEASVKKTVLENTSADSSENLPADFRYYEPLRLDIMPDEEGISHSWRPNMSDDALCPNLFVPPFTCENFQSNSNEAPNVNLNAGAEMVRYPFSPGGKEFMVYYNYPSYIGPPFNEDIPSYLRTQKSHMNALWYEVIKTKIEIGDLKECLGKLNCELNEKMESKSVEEIEELNKEIVQLRLECQCLCSEVDHLLNNQGVLGEVDEKCYEEIETSPNKADTQSKPSHQCTNSPSENNAVSAPDESATWECSKCTFVNHSAIKVCEMCNVPKPGTRLPPFINATSSSCYCHPNEKSLSVLS